MVTAVFVVLDTKFQTESEVMSSYFLSFTNGLTPSERSQNAAIQTFEVRHLQNQAALLQTIHSHPETIPETLGECGLAELTAEFEGTYGVCAGGLVRLVRLSEPYPFAT